MKCDLFLVGEAYRNRPYDVPSVLLDYGLRAQESGFDGVWFAEHHFIRYGACPSAVLLAGSLLARTTRLQVGTAACMLSNRHPVALAEESVMLEALSGGRFMLGVARGGPWIDLEVFGTGAARFERGFPEALDVLRGWTSGASTMKAAGEFFNFRDVPVQAPPFGRFPIWVAATSVPTVELAARSGLPLLLGVHAGDQEKASLIDRYAQVAVQHGHDPLDAEHAAVYLAFAADSHSIGRAQLRQPLLDWLSAGVGDYQRLDGTRGSSDQAGYVDRLLSAHLVGSPAECAEKLADSADRTGIKRAMLLVEGAQTTDLVTQNIARLGAELLPLFRAGSGGLS